jgi:hypothetical protein
MKRQPSKTSLYIALFLVAVIVIITLISASNIGFKMTRETATSLPKDQMIQIQKEDQPYPPQGKGIKVQTITATNSIIPRRLPLARTHACLYNTQTGEGVDVGASFQHPAIMPQREFEVPPGEILDIGIGETKTITVSVMPYVMWVPKDPNAPKPRPQDFDTLYLFVSETEDYFYPQCYNLPEEHKAMAIRIPLV